MKKLVAMLAFGLACLGAALGQGVSVEVVMDQEYFLPHEELLVKVRITNFSGQTLQLGQDDDWLSFAVEGRNNLVIVKTAPPLVKGEFALESSKVATRTVDLAPCFDLSRPTHYSVRATVRLPQFQSTLSSEKKGFDIMTGAKLWEQDFGVPTSELVAGAPPEVRKYALLQTIHGKQLKLYVRLSNGADTTVYRIYPIGPMISFSKPEPQLDRFGNLHVLWQIGARSFNHSVISPDGLVIARETHDYYNGSRPGLRAGQDGRIFVAGGTRRIAKDDLPPTSASLSPNDVESPK